MVKKLDSLDEKIIRLLQKDGRQRSDKLAELLSISPSTVRRRIRKLVQDDVIRITVSVDAIAAGYPILAGIYCTVAHGSVKAAMLALSKHPQAIVVANTTGRFNIVISAIFRSANELSDFLHTELNKIEGLQISETSLTLELAKGRHLII